MKCAVIVSAYRAQRHVLKCVKSIMAQRPPEGWTYELRLGVDGCRATATMLQKARIPFYYIRDNRGTYIMANSLVALGPADMFARFDADDSMLPGYLANVIPVALDYGICHAPHRLHGKRFSKPRVGQVTFTAATLEALGGFHAARCHCDRDFARRARLIGLDIRAMRADPRLKKGLFIKGVHMQSITHDPKYGTGSHYRRRVRAELGKLRAAGALKIKPKTVELKRWEP